MISTNFDIDKYRYPVQYPHIDIHRYPKRHAEERAEMHDSLIAWMMSGGNRFETTAERKDRENARVLREVREVRPDAHTAAALRSAIAPVRARALAALGVAATAVNGQTTTPDCCAA
jgi:hypothetical protein